MSMKYRDPGTDADVSSGLKTMAKSKTCTKESKELIFPLPIVFLDLL
jgi:hypothetical protein